MQKCKIKSVKSLGLQPTYNVTMKSEQHNYAIFGDSKDKFIISRNSHAVGYTYISSRMLWLKAHLPKQFFASMFTHTKASSSKDYWHNRKWRTNRWL